MSAQSLFKSSNVEKMVRIDVVEWFQTLYSFYLLKTVTYLQRDQRFLCTLYSISTLLSYQLRKKPMLEFRGSFNYPDNKTPMNRLHSTYKSNNHCFQDELSSTSSLFPGTKCSGTGSTATYNKRRGFFSRDLLKCFPYIFGIS